MRALFVVIAAAFVTTSAMGQTPQAQSATQHFSGTIGGKSSRNSFELQLAAGQIVTMTTSSSGNLDTVLTLNGPNGQRVAQNDDRSPTDLSSRIVYAPPTAGRYTAVVTGFNGAAGAFQLTVTPGFDAGLSAAARSLREETRTFDGTHPEFRFPVDLRGNDIFVATTFALAENLDTTLTLVGPDGLIVAQNDDRGDGTLNSQLVFQAAAPGHYELVASTFENHGTGNFAISLALDPNAHAPFNFASIRGTPIAHYEGQINDAHPSQDYFVNLAAGQTLLAISDATNGNLDTVLRLSGADGYPVAMNDDRGDGSLNSGFAFTAPQAGRYHLEIYRYEQTRTSGAFRLTLSSVDHSAVDTLQALVEEPITLSGPEQIVETANFRVHYTTEGRDATTAENAHAVADTLEHVLDIQTHRVGWAAPIRDRDGHYRAYVGYAEGNMGYTKAVQMVFDNPNTANVRERASTRAALVINNDFAHLGKKASPESLMHATVTHEFNHVVQYGYDGQERLSWLYEATASWTETTTVGDDQDATDYVATDFAAPEKCWTTRTRGFDYGQWTLLQSLADRYGEHFIVGIWQNSVRYDGFETMSQSLASVGTTIPDAIARWRVQNFAMDYRLAPLFTRSVHAAGVIGQDGLWTSHGGVEQLGANYLELRTRGPRTYALQGDSNLELIGLGQRDGQIQVVPLGRGGVFDTSGFQYAALMVFNRAMPTSPGECSAANYSINIARASGAMASPQYHFSAAHFLPPS
ncbi:MAG: PPC domain-containing protein [Proteobacteria bacterium]|nr:PPC domain-containing protein [Pseudomonadota bacterium]